MLFIKRNNETRRRYLLEQTIPIKPEQQRGVHKIFPRYVTVICGIARKLRKQEKQIDWG